MAVRLASFLRRVFSVLRYGIAMETILVQVQESQRGGTKLIGMTSIPSIARSTGNFGRLSSPARCRRIAPAIQSLDGPRRWRGQNHGRARALEQLAVEDLLKVVSARALRGLQLACGRDAVPYFPAGADGLGPASSHPPPRKWPLVDSSRPEIDFGFGRSFAERFPYDIWRRLLGRYLSTDDAMLSRYGSGRGFLSAAARVG